jgi:stage III sporulation protein AB
MLKILGSICILVGSTGIGTACSRDLTRHIEELENLQRLFLFLQGEIRYMHCPLPEAFYHLEQKCDGVYREFFWQTAQELEQGQGATAEEIWKRNLHRFLSGQHLAAGDLQELEKLGTMLGYLDVESQLGALAYYQEQLKAAISDARKKAEKRRSLYSYLGVLGGLLLVVLML